MKIYKKYMQTVQKKRTKAQQTKWERAVEGLTFDRLEKKENRLCIKTEKKLGS
jgi:hypothetical protein